MRVCVEEVGEGGLEVTVGVYRELGYDPLKLILKGHPCHIQEVGVTAVLGYKASLKLCLCN